MKRAFCVFIIFVLGIIPMLGFAAQITVFDNQIRNPGDTWYNTTGEDQEVEPGAVSTQAWDLEGMFFDGRYLSIVGGWDFKGKLNDIGSGDIFISTMGKVSYGSGIIDGSINQTVENSFGYNYVFDVDWQNNAYTLWQIDENTLVTTATAFGRSNPVAYAGGSVRTMGQGNFVYTAGLTDAATGFTGVNHFQVSGFDLSPILGADLSFIAHFTQECGNDVIMGQVPEPGTLILLGMGLLGISAIGRKHAV
jgi:hypothetical protein